MLAASFTGVRCPVCERDDTRVVDSRAADEGVAIRRRRECGACRSRFTTFERTEEVPVAVIKRSGDREPFDGDKLVRGVISASKGRPVEPADVDQLVADVEEGARAGGGTVSSEWVGLTVLDRLRQLDQVACLRFASVYKQFDDIGDFEREARLIKLDRE